LPVLEREFECRSVKYKVRLFPARVKSKDGVYRDYYPSQREELVEDALRKLAVEGHGLFLDELASVTFTLYQLQQELKARGHTLSIVQIKESLTVCVRTNLEITTEDGNAVLMSNIFETVGMRTLEDWKGKGQKTKCYVRFNSLVTKSIRDKSFRQFNYAAAMSYQNIIARQLHKRLAHHYRQASLMESYSIMLSTIIRDFGLTRYDELTKNLRQVKKALTEMEAKDVLLSYKIEPVLDAKKHNKLLDAKIILTTHMHFNAEIREANQKQKEITQFPPPPLPFKR
jgi:hypothetical protein